MAREPKKKDGSTKRIIKYNKRAVPEQPIKIVTGKKIKIKDDDTDYLGPRIKKK